MPCSYCNEVGHNIRTCQLHFKRKRRKRNPSEDTPIITNLLEKAIKDRDDLQDKLDKLEEINAKLYHNMDIIKAKNKVLEDNIQDKMGQIIVTRCKFRSAMLILKDRNIHRTTAAEPNNIPFDCPVCFDKKNTGIECSNGHKLCSTCAYENLWFSNQTCPCCREPYQEQNIVDVCNQAGIQVGLNEQGERTVKMDKLVTLVTKDMNGIF